jgi:hypothetical protein
MHIQHELTMSYVLCLCPYCKLIEVNTPLDFKYVYMKNIVVVDN